MVENPNFFIDALFQRWYANRMTAFLQVFQSHKTAVLGGLVALALVVLVIAVGLSCGPADTATPAADSDGVTASSAKQATSSPVITWTPRSLEETVEAGTTETVPVSFVAAKDLSDVTVRVVPELEPYVSVSPATLSSVAAGQPITLTVEISSPVTAIPGTIEGTIQIRQSGQNTIARPLSTAVRIVWSEFQSAELGFSIAYPPTYIAVSDYENSKVGFSQSHEAFQQGIAAILTVRSGELPPGASLHDWIETLGMADSGIEELTVGSRQFSKWSEFMGDELGNLTSYGAELPQGKFIIVSTPSSSLAGSQAFEAILSSIDTDLSQ